MSSIKKLKEGLHKKLFKEDDNGREINIYKLENSQPIGETLYYPNCLLLSSSNIYNPVDELTMSLSKVKYKPIIYKEKPVIYKENNTVFYFIYNTDNYYHFVYDTIPYLISFLKLRNDIKDIKLLMNYPNSSKNTFYRFVNEFLNILEIYENDIIIVNENTMYDSIYISSSYTHGEDSNLPPRKEIYDFYSYIVNIVKENNNIEDLPKNIYISRRTWINNDLSNIGTNYTTRRKLVNEDELVKELDENGYKEIFTENLTTIEKILMFQNADNIVGSIGGGLCNVLFSNSKTNLVVLVSPTFLDINERFKYSFQTVNTKYFHETYHIDKEYWKPYMRVSSGDIVGEIESVNEKTLTISYVDEKVAGWNSSMSLNITEIPKCDCIALDNGLNSPWSINIKKLINGEINCKI